MSRIFCVFRHYERVKRTANVRSESVIDLLMMIDSRFKLNIFSFHSHANLYSFVRIKECVIAVNSKLPEWVRSIDNFMRKKPAINHMPFIWSSLNRELTQNTNSHFDQWTKLIHDSVRRILIWPSTFSTVFWIYCNWTIREALTSIDFEDITRTLWFLSQMPKLKRKIIQKHAYRPIAYVLFI